MPAFRFHGVFVLLFRRSLEQRTLADDEDHVEQSVLVGGGLLEQFVHRKAVARGQLPTDAVGEQAA